MNWTKAATIALALSAFIGVANAQQAADGEAVKAANQSFYTALSARDLKAMQAVWANKPYVVNIGPRSKIAAVGYDEAVTKYWGQRVQQCFLEGRGPNNLDNANPIGWETGLGVRDGEGYAPPEGRRRPPQH